MNATSATRSNRSGSSVAVVYNPVKVDVAKLRSAVAIREAKHGWGPSLWFETTAQDPGAGMARQAVARGASVVLACGGDGTVRSVAGGLEGSTVPLGIVPLGTGNLLARNLGIPIDSLDGALAVALGGTTRMVDLGRVTYTTPDGTDHEEMFLVMVGIGMDADMIAGADEDLKAAVGWVAYIKSFATSAFSGHRLKAHYHLDDQPERSVLARSVIVGNCGVLQAGLVLMPGAQLTDGRLDLVALRPKGPVGWTRLAYAVLVQNTVLARLGVPPARKWAEKFAADMDRRGAMWAELVGTEGARRFTEKASIRRQRTLERRAEAAALDHRQGKVVTLHVEDGAAAFEIDGDEIGEVAGFRAEVRHLSLALRVPSSKLPSS